MGKNKRKKRKKGFDSYIKSKPKILITRDLVYRYNVSNIDGRITLVICSDKGKPFMFTYSNVDSCLDSRDSRILNFKEVERELKRLLGDDAGIIAHKDAIFKMGVLNW